MPRILQTVHLSDFQSKVMAIIKSAPTPQVAFNELSQQPAEQQNNITGARDVLQDLGLITSTQDTVEITDKGVEVMKDEYLIDEFGKLTDKANQLIADTQEPSTSDIDGEMNEPIEPTDINPEEFPTESLSLLRDLNTLAESLKFKKN